MRQERWRSCRRLVYYAPILMDAGSALRAKGPV